MPFSAPALSRLQSVRVKCSLLVLAICAALGMPGLENRADAQCAGTGTTTYTSTGGVSVPKGMGQKLSTNTISVPTLPTGSTITCVSVVLNGVTSDGSQSSESMLYASFMLTAPSGQNFEFLGSTGDGSDGTGLAGINIAVADNASTAAPISSPWTSSETVKPSSYYIADGSNAQPPLPVGGTSLDWAQSDGAATFVSKFATVATPSGNWTLTLTDNDLIGVLNGDPVSVTSWSLVMTVIQTSNADTSTALSSSSTNNTSETSNSVTFTADVTSSGGTPTGTVNFTDGGTTISGCGAKTLSGGSTICTTTFSTEGIHTIEASYSGGTGFNQSNSGLNQFVKNHSTLTSGQYCNTDAIVETPSTVSPYPSVINVGTDTTALGGTVANVTVTLNGLSDSQGLGTQDAFLLVAPDRSKAYNLDFMSDVGVSGSQASVNLTFADLNPSAPSAGSLSSGTYEATDNHSSADTFPASLVPAPSLPGTINYAQPHFFTPGSPFTFAQAFDGANGNGDWALFGINSTGTTINVTGGWCLAFDVNNGSPTTTTLTSPVNPAATGSSVTLTATVTSGGDPISSGTVTFTENGVSPAGVGANTVSLNGSGQASISTSALTEGDHNITATYNGVSNTFDSSSASLWQRIDTTSTVSGTNPVTVCNPGGITLPNQAPSADNIGAAAPNPSNIFVSNLPGALSSVDVDLVNFQTNNLADSVLWTSSLLVGPGASTASSIDFFSGTGLTDNNTKLAEGNYIFSDSGTGEVPQADYGPGTYKPTSYANGQIKGSYTASPSGFYTLPGTYNYAAPRGTTTFDDLYNDTTNPNGTWSLYFYQNTSLDGPATATAWCMDFNLSLPAVTVTTGHTGNFTQGQQNAPFTVGIDNNGPGSTGDPSGGSHPLTVTDTLNSAFTYSNFSGTDWSCSASGQTVTCTNDDSVPHPGAYNELTIDVNVSPTASTPISNQVTTSGAEISATALSNADSITVVPSPVLSVAKSHTGSFTQGQTGTWTIAVGNSATGSTTSGTVTLTDILPSGYTISSATGTNWSCTGTGTGSLSCSDSVGTVSGGASFPAITLTVNVPANSPASVQNVATASGGGALASANSNTDTVTVIQVVAVPNVVGQTQTAATTAITGAGLVVGTVTTASSSTAPSGSVISQSPIAATMVNVGSAVNLVVSSGPAQVAVPNVVGQTQTAATTAITGAGLVVGTVTTASSSTVPSGSVISQSPVAATMVNVGSAVNLVVSSGPAHQPPAITSANHAAFTLGAASSFTVTTTGVPIPASITELGGLPAGVTFTNNGNGTATLAGTPTAGGTFNIGFTASNGVSPNATQSFTLTTSGPLANVSPSTLSFGTVYLGTFTPKAVTVTNTGNATMTINDPLLSIAQGGDSSEFFVLNLCPRSLAPGKSCTIFVTFVAGPFFNPQTATLNIMDNVPGIPQQVSLTALVIDPLALPSVANWNFGTQKVNTSSTPKVVTLSNPGLTTLTINSITIAGANFSDFSETNNCPASLAPKGSCTIDVTFKPTAKGSRSSSVAISDNAFNSSQRISLSGTGD